MSETAQQLDSFSIIKEFLLATLKEWWGLQKARSASGMPTCCLSLNNTWMWNGRNSYSESSLCLRPITNDLIDETARHGEAGDVPPDRGGAFLERLKLASEVLGRCGIVSAIQPNADDGVPYLVIELAQERLLENLQRVWNNDIRKDPDSIYVALVRNYISNGALQSAMNGIMGDAAVSILGPEIVSKLAADKRREIVMCVIREAASAISKYANANDIRPEQLRDCVQKGMPEIFPKPDRQEVISDRFPPRRNSHH